jgi:hypothetical protein
MSSVLQRKNILVSIFSFGNHQLDLQQRVIDEYKSYKNFDVEITLETTLPAHRREFERRQDEFDLFLYTENDILIREETIETYLKYDRLLPDDSCLGFLVYEDLGGTPVLVEQGPNPPDMLGNTYVFGDIPFFEVSQVHQCCWLLPRSKLKNVMRDPRFFHGCESGECAASCFFSKHCFQQIKKVLVKSKEDLRKCLIQHLSNRYASPSLLTFDEFWNVVCQR